MKMLLGIYFLVLALAVWSLSGDARTPGRVAHAAVFSIQGAGR